MKVVEDVPVSASTFTSDGSRTFLPKGNSLTPGYPFITFLTSTQTGSIVSLAEKNKSILVRKQPPFSSMRNVCDSGSPLKKHPKLEPECAEVRSLLAKEEEKEFGLSLNP